MAYMSQEKKASLAPRINEVLKKYGVKGTLSVDNHSSLVVTLSAGTLKFASTGGYCQVNPFWIGRDFSGVERKFLEELKAAMMVGNHDRSDSMTDYSDVGWYVDINIGRWNKPYQVTA